jgi:WXG100 family type VII secretion target
MNLVGDPGAIYALADTLDRNATHLRSVGKKVQESTDQTRGKWECDKAKLFRATMAGRRQQADGMAQDLNNIAKALRDVAARVQGQIDDLHGFERRVRSAISAAGHGAEWALERGVDVTRLPDRTDPAWESIARKLL